MSDTLVGSKSQSDIVIVTPPPTAALSRRAVAAVVMAAVWCVRVCVSGGCAGVREAHSSRMCSVVCSAMYSKVPGCPNCGRITDYIARRQKAWRTAGRGVRTWTCAPHGISILTRIERITWGTTRP